MNIFRSIALLVLLSFMCYAAVSQEVTEEEENKDNGLVADSEGMYLDNAGHERYKRAKKKKGKNGGKKAAGKSGLLPVEDCPAGTRLPRNCEPCPVGFYSDKKGLWQDCLPCKEGETTLPDDATKCVEKCGSGMTWNRDKQSDCKKVANRRRARCKNCVQCQDNQYKFEAGNEPCSDCPEYFMANDDFTGCVIRCPAGYEPKSDNSIYHQSCSPCMFGYYKPKAGGPDDQCKQCKDGETTLETGATKESQCIKTASVEGCSRAITLVNGLLLFVTIKNPTLNDVISQACEAYKDSYIDICEILDALSKCNNAMAEETHLVFRDGSSAFSLADLLDADIPCIRWEEATGRSVNKKKDFSYSWSSSSSYEGRDWSSYDGSDSSWSSSGDSSDWDDWYLGGKGDGGVDNWGRDTGSGSGGGNNGDGKGTLGWDDISEWLGGDDGADFGDAFNLLDTFKSWFSKRDVHKRSLSGSGGPVGRVCKPNIAGRSSDAEFKRGKDLMQKVVWGTYNGDGTTKG